MLWETAEMEPRTFVATMLGPEGGKKTCFEVVGLATEKRADFLVFFPRETVKRNVVCRTAHPRPEVEL
jgi:hypothetical protein